ncbi:glycosyltransferase [Bradyrhizobium sp. MOS002]|uniref:glycosyltransferase n=1 Tax=Bradyrhizobium sp. MOS002 TaxID=2133947 RepID=UPI000D117C8B|nr:glycosyltransferase [Bradyrhizobium sp. MOS002]PSO23658.1 glycosyl transferase family 1 [Bradyrhizobium sp. MOS002]
MRKPTILHAYKVFVPDMDGGIPSVIRTLCVATKTHFENQVLVARKRGAGKTYVTGEGINVEAVRSFGTLFSTPIAPTFPFRLAKLSADADLVVHHAPFPLNDVAIPFFDAKTPLILYWHADVASFPLLKKAVRPAMWRALRRANRIIISDYSILESAELLKPFAEKCLVIPYGTDLSFWANCDSAEADAAAKLRARHPRMILAIGRLVPYKGFDVLLQSLAGLDAEAVIVGEGPLLSSLQERANDLGLAHRVIFKGRLNQAELKAHLYAARALAFPSVTTAEAFGIVQVEAMAAGLPIVNTSLPTAVPNVARDGQEAITVAPNQPEALGKALAAIMGNQSLAQALGQAGRTRALSEYSQPGYSSKIQSIYRDLIERRTT